MQSIAYKVKHIGAGAYHVLVAGHDGKVSAWGKNTKGALGVGHTNHVDWMAPEDIKSLDGIPIKQVGLVYWRIRANRLLSCWAVGRTRWR